MGIAEFETPHSGQNVNPLFMTPLLGNKRRLLLGIGGFVTRGCKMSWRNSPCTRHERKLSYE